MSVISRGFIEVENIIVELNASWASYTLCATIPSRCPENHVSDHESGYLFSTRVLLWLVNYKEFFHKFYRK